MTAPTVPAEVLQAIADARHPHTDRDRVFKDGDRRWRVVRGLGPEVRVLVFERRVGRKWLRWSDTQVGDATRKAEATR